MDKNWWGRWGLFLFGLFFASNSSAYRATPYEILNISKHECIVDIERAFRREVRALEARTDLSDAEKRASRLKVTEAWETLTLPERRAASDAKDRARVRRENIEHLLEQVISENPSDYAQTQRLAKKYFQKLDYQLSALELMRDAGLREEDTDWDDTYTTLYWLEEWLERNRPFDPRFTRRLIELVEEEELGEETVGMMTALLGPKENDPVVWRAVMRWLPEASSRGIFAFKDFFQHGIQTGKALLEIASLLTGEVLAATRAQDLLSDSDFAMLSPAEEEQLAEILWTVVQTKMRPPVEMESMAPQFLSRIRVPERIQMEMVRDLEQTPRPEHKGTIEALAWLGDQWTPAVAFLLIESLQNEEARPSVKKLLRTWEDDFPDSLKSEHANIAKALRAVKQESTNPRVTRFVSKLLATFRHRSER